MPYDAPAPSTPSPDPSDRSAPSPDPSDPSVPSPAASSGRHRRGGPVRRRALPRPGFAAAVLATGTTAAVVTILLGLYAAMPPSAPAPRAAPPPTPQAPPPTLPTPAPTSPRALVEAPRAPAAARGDGAGTAAGGLVPQTGTALAAPVKTPSRATRYGQEVVALVNAERGRAGCGPLRSEARLARAAQGHADDMAARDYYAHASPEGRDGGDRISAHGYDWSAWGENIHKGPKTPERAMEEWMGSAAHRANILNCSFRDIGVGVALTADGPWWVQDFGTRG
ncbi:CAP domain-containing protein [Streptomyces sp. NPDC057854]|uniref:CAP domain-containing protein n=1 Tax=unclassified Streptomyces TaxID=2593676 RepID=UPI0036A9D97D